MLISFSVGNYKVFKDSVRLDMQGSSISKVTDNHIIDAGRFKLLKSAVVYGPNASGKSNFLEAMIFMRDFVVHSSKNTQANETIPVDPFRLNTVTVNQSSSFEIEFLLEGIRYRYGFEATRERIEQEWLLYRPRNVSEKALFARLKDEIEITPKFKEGKGIEKRTRPNALFLSSVAQWNGQLSQQILEWFNKIKFFDGNWEWREEDDFLTLELLRNKKYKALIASMLRMADLGIDDIEAIEYKDIIANKTGKKLPLASTFEHLVTAHKVYDGNNKVVDSVHFDMDEDESVGTQRFFSLIGLIINVLQKGEILISDEINVSLHPMLMQAIVLLFNSKIANVNGGQFIFTTHDTNLIDAEFLSRDQIYFIEKNSYGSSKLTSLVEFKARKDVNHEREYFRGRYGAIPFIENFEKLFQKMNDGENKNQAA